MKKKTTNEELCSALLTHGTIKDTAQALDVSEKTVYNMMSETDFKKMYDSALKDVLSSSVISCNGRLSEAIECISDIMRDKSVNPQTRLQAGQTILKNSILLYDVMNRTRDRERQAKEEMWDFLDF